MKIINMFRVGIPTPQLPFQGDIIIIIVLIITERNQTKRIGGKRKEVVV